MPTTKVAPVAIENPSWMALTFAGMSGSIWERNCAGTWTRIGPTTVLLRRRWMHAGSLRPWWLAELARLSDSSRGKSHRARSPARETHRSLPSTTSPGRTCRPASRMLTEPLATGRCADATARLGSLDHLLCAAALWSSHQHRDVTRACTTVPQGVLRLPSPRTSRPRPLRHASSLEGGITCATPSSSSSGRPWDWHCSRR
jgi:hypothetical protein